MVSREWGYDCNACRVWGSFPIVIGWTRQRGAARGELAALFCFVLVVSCLSYRAWARKPPEESQNEYRTTGRAWMLRVVNRLRCGAHLAGPGGSHHFCAIAS